MRTVSFRIFTLCFILTIGQAAGADATQISYKIGWSQPNSHLLEITMRIADLQANSVDVSIPAWRPGRYVIQNYAKNVIDFAAFDEQGRRLQFRKLDKGTWRIDKEPSLDIVVRYTYYARHLDGGSSYLDDSEAYINPITCLMYVPGKERLPVSLALEKPADWRIATALEFEDGKGAFVSENYHELVDGPILASPSFKLLTFEESGATYEIALQGKANYKEEQLIDDIRKIVAEQTEIMQDVPFKRYLFMYHLLPYRFGHGVEHKNSTSIVLGPTDFDDEKFYQGFLSVTAHEFFHAWNVERIRPEAIYSPDYSKENYTTTMWIYEGMTSYYGNLALVRTHLMKKKKYFENWAKTLKSFQNTYGRKVMSVDRVSWDSWTKSMGNAPPNTYYSFYTKGNILGMLLDLEIRRRTKNKRSLDHVLRYLCQEYAQKNRGVPEDGLERAVGKIAGSSFETFFGDYVHGTEEIDYNRYLQQAGLELLTKHDEKGPGVYLGISTAGDEKETRIGNVTPESPAFEAGLDINDVLLAIDGRRANKSNLNLLLKEYTAGDTIRVTVFRRDELRHLEVVLAAALPDKYEIKEIEAPTELQVEIKKSWLNLEEEKEVPAKKKSEQ